MTFPRAFAALMLAAFLTVPVAADAASTDYLRTFFSLPYATADETRLAFPDELTVSSWGDPEAVEVDTATLAARAMAGIVPLRQGTHLVKFGENPKVYAIGQGGTLHWIPDEATAVKFYGSDWESRIVTLFESYWSNYEFGQDVVSAHPDGTLIKYPERATVYYVQAGLMRPFASEDAFYANHFRFPSVVTVSDPFGYTEGPSITGYEPSLDIQSI